MYTHQLNKKTDNKGTCRWCKRINASVCGSGRSKQKQAPKLNNPQPANVGIKLKSNANFALLIH